MICCKIIIDSHDSKGSISTLLKDLSKNGDFLWDNGNLFFSNTDDMEFTKEKLQNILINSGYDQSFIFVYHNEDDLKETDYINGWITDRLTTINYLLYEYKSQETFQNISKGLKMLNDEIENLKKQKKEGIIDEQEEQK